MNIEASFALTAILISALILYYYYRLNKVNDTQGFIFVLLVADNTLTAFSSYSKWALSRFVTEIPDAVLSGMSYIYFLTHTMMILLVFLYILFNVRSWKEIALWAKVAVIVPITVAEIMVLTNPIHHLIYSYSNGIYRREPGMIVTYLAFAYYFILTLFVIIWHNKGFSNKDRTVVLILLAVGLSSVVIQMLRHEYQVEVFAIALSELIMFLFILNPTEQMDVSIGTYSRSAFVNRMRDGVISRRRFDLVIADIRNYRDYERKHEKGGRPLMQAVARRLNELIPAASVYRLSENTLAIEVLKPKARETAELVSLLEEEFKKTWEIDKEMISMQAHLLKLSFPDDIQDTEQLHALISRFRNNNYENKSLTIKDFDMQGLERYRKISGALARVIDKKQFEVRYTPVYSMALSRVIGAEVGVRFYDDELGYVYHDEIFDYAERSGHAVQLGALMFEDICSFISEHKLDSMGLSFLMMKIMPAISMQQGMMDAMRQIVEKYDLDPKIFCLQITEQTISRATPVFKNNIRDLHEAGVRLCLEDYGSGFTNIASIYEMPFSILMVNQSVMHAAMANEKARITMDCTLAMARDLSMMTMVAGINDEKMFDVISDMAVDFSIGNYYFEQLDGEEFLKVARISAEEGGVEA